ncbi:MAG TPA: hypothetical protein VK481_12830 [Gemmatimonadaceae bacterium]|nr:hypothetical protein [Gemmatimonadaceae bacterium]
MKLASSLALVALLPFASYAPAQETTADLPVTPNTKLFAKLEQFVIKVHKIFDPPLHPVISGVGPGGSLGAGLGYNSPGQGPWSLKAKAVYTLNNYWSAEAIAGFKNRRSELEAFARAREMRQVDYFGIGPESQLFNRTSYAYRDPVVGADGRFRVTPWLAVGGRLEEIWPYARSGRRLPTIESRFFPVGAPGLFAQPLFGRYQGSVDIHIPGGAGDAFYQGTKARATYAIYDDQADELYNFKRVDLEAQQILAGFGAHHRLTLSAWASSLTPAAGDTIPFSLMPTLGGRSSIRSVNDNRLGSDGTEATLRGYRDLRFRDRNLLLVQAEYRVPIWGPFDATVFADAGKVAPLRSDLDFTDLRRDFGFSFSIMKGWETWARVDVGFGTGEGTRVFFSFGDLTP